MKETYKNWNLKVGDEVKLLISNTNFNTINEMRSFDNPEGKSSMEYIVIHNPVVTITQLTQNDIEDCRIRFDNSGAWSWCAKDGHFVPYKKQTKLEDMSYLITLIKKLQ